MHVSLDSALGRQRRLNSVGESITQIAPDPVAAYSLRSLTGSDPKVVRVRRDSDNDEQDFTASEVSSGALVDYVNSQVTKPLDVRELVSGGSDDGRTGDFVIAKAAYSLRSLGDRQATVAATNDTVARADGKYVVQVRRSSDDTIKSFTADEVNDGTLVNFVNGNWENVLYSTFVNGESWQNGFTAVNTGSSAAGLQIPSGVSGDTITITVDVTFNSGSPSPSFSLRDASGGNVRSDVVFVTSEGSHTITLTANGNFSYIVIGEGDSPSGFTVSNVVLSVVPTPLYDGFVRALYDQSVSDQAGSTATGNHAIQSTAANQPTIVSNGSLLADGIDFDGTDDKLETAASISGSNISGFVVANLDGTAANSLYSVGNTKPNVLFGNPSLAYSLNGGVALSGGTAPTNTDTLFTQLFISGGTSKTFIDGSAIASGDAGSNTASSDKLTIGNLESGDRFMDGSIKELIIYNSNQTDNRGAFEANIAEHYGISGVPAEDNQVNGFVETWYDQSGNNRPLIQTTAANQPLIVESGVFLNGVKANEATSNTDMMHLRVSTDGTTANFGTDDWASGASSKLGLIYVGTVLDGPNFSNDAVVWGGGRGVNNYQEGGVSLQVIKAGTDNWKLMNERDGLSPEQMSVGRTLNTDADVVWYGTANNRDFTVNVNGSENTDTESADLDVRENTALSLFGAFGATGGAHYQRSSKGVCKECFLYAGDNITNVPAVATKINEHYSIY